MYVFVICVFITLYYVMPMSLYSNMVNKVIFEFEFEFEFIYMIQFYEYTYIIIIILDISNK